MTTTTTLTTAIPCPAWCTVDHAGDPPGGFHASAWTPPAIADSPTPSDGLPGVTLWQTDAEGSRPGVVVAGHLLDHAAAHELGMALVRAADVVRRQGGTQWLEANQ